jgi:hypothetical protein
MQRHLDSREEELKRRTEQVMELTSKVWETDWWEPTHWHTDGRPTEWQIDFCCI